VKKLTGRLLRISLSAFTLGVAVVVTIWLIRAFDARKLPDLQVWHTYEAKSEFRARDYPDGISLGEYRELEDRLFAEIDEHVYGVVGAENSELFNRYNKQGQAYAGDEGMAWNRSFVIDTPNPVGGILLLHGASDSPYSVKALAETFASHGLYVAVFRMPGHGTIPTGLKVVKLEDWRAIARAGVQHVAEKLGPDMPVYFGGYSAGAALAVDYALDAVLDDSLPVPDRLFLYSPSIAVTPFARFSDWDLALASIPYFRKFAWMELETEYDPYKYNSFPKNGGYLAFQLSENIVTKMTALNNTEDAPLLPPTIAFQSLVDSTVRTEALIYDVFDQMPNNGHELVLFDINRSEVLSTVSATCWTNSRTRRQQTICTRSLRIVMNSQHVLNHALGSPARWGRLMSICRTSGRTGFTRCPTSRFRLGQQTRSTARMTRTDYRTRALSTTWRRAVSKRFLPYH